MSEVNHMCFMYLGADGCSPAAPDSGRNHILRADAEFRTAVDGKAIWERDA